MSDASKDADAQPVEVPADEYAGYAEWQAWLEETLRQSGATPDEDMDAYFSAIHDAQIVPQPDTGSPPSHGSQPSHGPDIEP